MRSELKEKVVEIQEYLEKKTLEIVTKVKQDFDKKDNKIETKIKNLGKG